MNDIGLDENEDLEITGGDFDMRDNTAQHQRQLLLNNKGDFKENPTTCVGAFGYLDEENFRGLIRAVNIEFSRDGMEVNDVALLPDGTVSSDAVYQ